MALFAGFDIREAASIGIIGGAEGPTTIYVTSILAPHIIGATAIATYSYMALVPVIQPPIIRLLTTKKERAIYMKPQLREVSTREKILFPVIASVIVILFVPLSAPLIGMFMVGQPVCCVRRHRKVQQDVIHRTYGYPDYIPVWDYVADYTATHLSQPGGIDRLRSDAG